MSQVVSPDVQELIVNLTDVLWESCGNSKGDKMDSGFSGAYADAMRLLARYGVLTILFDSYPEVIAQTAPAEDG